MAVLNLRLAESLHRKIGEVAERDGGVDQSMDQFRGGGEDVGADDGGIPIRASESGKSKEVRRRARQGARVEPDETDPIPSQSRKTSRKKGRLNSP